MGGPTHSPKYAVDTQAKLVSPTLAGDEADVEVPTSPRVDNTHAAARLRTTQILRIVTCLREGRRRWEEAVRVRDDCLRIGTYGRVANGNPDGVLLGFLAGSRRVRVDGIDQLGPTR